MARSIPVCTNLKDTSFRKFYWLYSAPTPLMYVSLFSYMVIAKVGKPTERSKPGNRGKRDSQILLLHYLNRVHFDAPMSPLELEIYHQMRNVIGIDPAFYEYIFTIDADTVRFNQLLIQVTMS
jgi:chitin synthase